MAKCTWAMHRCGRLAKSCNKISKDVRRRIVLKNKLLVGQTTDMVMVAGTVEGDTVEEVVEAIEAEAVVVAVEEEAAGSSHITVLMIPPFTMPSDQPSCHLAQLTLSSPVPAVKITLGTPQQL